MTCPIHKRFYYTGEKCAMCEMEGLTVVKCEIDKIPRVLDTMSEQGHNLEIQSFAILVFKAGTHGKEKAQTT